MSKIAVTFKDIDFSYGPKWLLKSLNFKISDGEFISIIGPSGSGKTTLFRLISGLEEPKHGSILINGEKLKNRFGAVGYMPQQDLLMPWRTILENAALPLELRRVPKAAAHEQVKKLLVEFGLGGYEHHYINNLSGGMRQRVSFLRAILSGSNVLLLDEPFSALDAITKLSMQEWLLSQWEKWKQSILFITHDVNEALFLSDRIFVLADNPVQQIVEVDVPLNRPRSLHDLDNSHIIELKKQLIDRLRLRE
jgi:putative hydroxymethylpyrimidine transport system ATP-binding protein